MVDCSGMHEEESRSEEHMGVDGGEMITGSGSSSHEMNASETWNYEI